MPSHSDMEDEEDGHADGDVLGDGSDGDDVMDDHTSPPRRSRADNPRVRFAPPTPDSPDGFPGEDAITGTMPKRPRRGAAAACAPGAFAARSRE